jgi:hypothetical protein
MAVAVEIKRDVNLNFSVEEIKKAIELVSEKSKAFYQIKNKNEIMNTYSISLIGGMMVIVPISVQLKKITENETQLIINTTKATNNANQSNQILDKYLNILSQALSGEMITEENISKSKAGCMGLCIGIISVGSLLYFLI